jgi:hypothetical protein
MVNKNRKPRKTPQPNSIGVRFQPIELLELDLFVAAAGVPRNRLIRIAVAQYMADRATAA